MVTSAISELYINRTAVWEKNKLFYTLAYRKSAVQCQSAPGIFTARCYAKSGICRHAVSVRPSVCLSRSWIMSKRINISASHTILVFPCRRGWRYSDGTPSPLTRASNARRVWKNDDFRPLSPSISETVIGRWAHAARQFVGIEFSFHPYNI